MTSCFLLLLNFTSHKCYLEEFDLPLLTDLLMTSVFTPFAVRITAGALPRGLHILNLSKNSISTIEGLRELTRLRVLDLSYNRLMRIGHGMAS